MTALADAATLDSGMRLSLLGTIRQQGIDTCLLEIARHGNEASIIALGDSKTSTGCEKRTVNTGRATKRASRRISQRGTHSIQKKSRSITTNQSAERNEPNTTSVVTANSRSRGRLRKRRRGANTNEYRQIRCFAKKSVLGGPNIGIRRRLSVLAEDEIWRGWVSRWSSTMRCLRDNLVCVRSVVNQRGGVEKHGRHFSRWITVIKQVECGGSSVEHVIAGLGCWVILLTHSGVLFNISALENAARYGWAA